jgi:hypothetical protein
MGLRTYSRRERFLFGFLAPILGTAAAFLTYLVATMRDVLVWLALFGALGGTGVCLKIAITGRATRRLEQDAFEALAGRPLRDHERPDAGSPAV